jgi:predicted permease
VIAVAVAAAAVGIAAERRWTMGARRAARGVLAGMLYALVPFIVFFNIARGVVFAVGAAFGASAAEGVRERTLAFVTRNPPLLALVAAVLAPEALAPDALVDASRTLVFALVPLGFFAVGVTLAAEADDGAMPCGINTLVVAHAYGLDMRIAAGAVAWSTTIVVVVALVASAF